MLAAWIAPHGVLEPVESPRELQWPPRTPKADRRAEIAEGMRYLHLSLTDPMRSMRSDDSVVWHVAIPVKQAS